MGSHQRRRIEEQIALELLLILTLSGLAAIQVALLPQIVGVSINLLLLTVFIAGLLVGPAQAAHMALYGGIALDLCMGTPLGEQTLAFVLAALAATLPFQRINRSSWGLPLLAALFGAPVYYLVLGGLTALFQGGLVFQTYLQMFVLPGTIMALVPALPLFLAARWLRTRLRGEVRSEVF